MDQRNYKLKSLSLSICGFTQDANSSELNLVSLQSFSLLVLYHLTSSVAPIIIAAGTRVRCQVNNVHFNLLQQSTIVAIFLARTGSIMSFLSSVYWHKITSYYQLQPMKRIHVFCGLQPASLVN